MLSIGFDHLFMIHTAAVLVALGALWGRQLWRGSVQGWNVSQESLCRCRACGAFFVARRFESQVQCPRCQEGQRVRPRKHRRSMTY